MKLDALGPYGCQPPTLQSGSESLAPQPGNMPPAISLCTLGQLNATLVSQQRHIPSMGKCFSVETADFQIVTENVSGQ